MPLIAIIDWEASPLDDTDGAVERDVIGDAAQVKRFLCSSDADFNEKICGADALIVWHNTPITAAGLTRLRNCKVLVRNGVGFDSVDIGAARNLGIPVCNVPDYGTEEVADHAIALTLALCRQLFPLDEEAKRLGWVIRVQPKMRRLRELVFGVVGLGRDQIGRVAEESPKHVAPSNPVTAAKASGKRNSRPSQGKRIQ